MNPYVLSGLILAGIVLCWLLFRWESRRQADRYEAIIKEARPKICLNSEFVCRISHAATAEELVALDENVRSRADELFGDDFANLVERIKARLGDLDQ